MSPEGLTAAEIASSDVAVQVTEFFTQWVHCVGKLGARAVDHPALPVLMAVVAHVIQLRYALGNALEAPYTVYA